MEKGIRERRVGCMKILEKNMFYVNFISFFHKEIKIYLQQDLDSDPVENTSKQSRKFSLHLDRHLDFDPLENTS